ncbi:MAG: hypothetical protein GX630_10695 [Actinobacteria bacterium]|jgi:hypothetical protein|nr:hypothetical protein [Actinomycetota bacterium]
MRVSVAIMAHPGRAAFVDELLLKLDCDCTVVWDEHQDRYETGHRAWLAYDKDAAYHVVIQDDVIPCVDLIPGLERALDRVYREAPLCGYIGLYRPPLAGLEAAITEADERQASFITMKTLNFGQLVAAPTDSICDMVAYTDKLTDVQNYDRRLSRYWELERKIRVWYTWPSLVDHRVSPSFVPGRASATPSKPGGLVAHRFIGADQSALDLGWHGPVVHAKGLR